MSKGGFSWKRLLGISGAKARASRSTGIPFTKSGRQRKVGNLLTGNGCLIPIVLGAGLLLGSGYLVLFWVA